MTKTLKIVALLVLISALLLALTGCGNKVTGTIKTEQKIEVSFKDDKIDQIKMTVKYDSKDKAEEGLEKAEDSYDSYEEEDVKVKRSGNSVTVTLTGDAAKEYGEYAYGKDADKEDVKDKLEDLKYTVK